MCHLVNGESPSHSHTAHLAGGNAVMACVDGEEVPGAVGALPWVLGAHDLVDLAGVNRYDVAGVGDEAGVRFENQTSHDVCLGEDPCHSWL